MTDTITYWIQKADLSSQEYGAITVFDAVKVFQNHDWSPDLAMREKLEAAGEDFCDPGIGFVSADGRILHICPLDSQTGYFHYHFMQRSKILGIIPNNHQVTSSNMHIELSRIREAIEKFFVNNHDWLITHSQMAG